MMVVVHDRWEEVGRLPDGRPILACSVVDNNKLVGRIVDLGDGGYHAEYVTLEGEFAFQELPDYYSAVLYVANHVERKRRKLH